MMPACLRPVRLILLVLLALPLAACSHTRATSAPPAEAFPADARVLWLDATANFARLGTPDSLARHISNAADAGFTDLVVDVKPLSGEVLYASTVAPRLRTFGGYTRSDAFDFPAVAVAEGHRRGLRVHFAVNTFAEGHKTFSTGPIFTTHPEWQTILLTSGDSLRPTLEVKGASAFVNPANPVSQQYMLRVLDELVRRYRPDGLVIDRGRYDGIYSDFSDLSRQAVRGVVRAPGRPTGPPTS